MTEDEVVSLDGAAVRVGGDVILGPIDLTIRSGEHWVVLGPNGSGKTTLLEAILARTGAIARQGTVEAGSLHCGVRSCLHWGALRGERCANSFRVWWRKRNSIWSSPMRKMPRVGWE